MDYKQIKQHLSRAVEDATPDLRDQILLGCQQQKGARADMLNQPVERVAPMTPQADIITFPRATSKTEHRSPLFWTRNLAAVAMLFALVLTVNFGYNHFALDSVIGFDVNPSIEIRTNRSEQILSVTPLNQDAEIILDGMNLKNVDLDVAVNALIGSMLTHGYVNELNNSILITVENSNTQRGAELQQRLTDEVNTLLNAYSVDAAVVSQTLDEDARLRELAIANNISIGKAALVELLIQQDSRLKFEDIAKLSINEINLLIATRHTELQGVTVSGQASQTAYIGEAKAKSVALQHAGVTESNAKFVSVKLDWDDGRMVYDVEFYSGNVEYDYEIDATSGTVLAYDRDIESYSIPTQQSGNNTTNNNTNTNNTTDSYIGEAKAKSIALQHAGLSESQVSRMKVELDRDDGRTVYEVEFDQGRMEYSYDIDANSGAILEWDHDYDD